MELIPEDNPLHELNLEVGILLGEIVELIESGRLRDLKFEREEDQILQKLATDVKHREWRAVKTDVDLESKEEELVLRLQIHELREIRSKFTELKRLMRRSNLQSVLNKAISSEKQKEEFERKEEYYLFHIYKIISTYERIFRHLWDKERKLSAKLSKDSEGL